MNDITAKSKEELYLIIWNDEYLYKKVLELHYEGFATDIIDFLRSHFKYTVKQWDFFYQRLILEIGVE